jgi:hypothetical protein
MTGDAPQTEAPRGWTATACRTDDGCEWTWEDGRWYVGEEFMDAPGCGPHYDLADLRINHGPATVTAVDNVSALWVDWHRDHQLWAAEVRARALAPRDEAKDAAESALWAHFRLIVEGVEAERDAALAKVREYDNAINWNTTCTSCAAVLDSSYAETMRAEQAEAALDRVQALAESARSAIGIGCLSSVEDDNGALVCNDDCGGHRTTGWTLDPAAVLAALDGSQPTGGRP